MASQKGSKAKGRRSSKDNGYYAAQVYRTEQNKARKRARWLRKQKRLANPERQARLAADRKARRDAKRPKKVSVPTNENKTKEVSVTPAIEAVVSS
jgi:hypothetical protein